MMISTLGDQCLKAMVQAGSPATTFSEYDRIYRQFVTFLTAEQKATDDLRHFTPAQCRAFAAYLADKGVKPNTVRHKLSALSTLAKYGLLEHEGNKGRPYLQSNPLLTFPWPKRQRTKKEFLHPDELRAFLSVARPVNESVARDLLVDTALRVSELCRANLEDFVKLADGWVLYVTVKGEGRQDELVPVPVSMEVAQGVVEYLSKRPAPMVRGKGRVPLLLNSKGGRWTRYALGLAIKRMGAAAGIARIKVSPHKLRRTSNIVTRYGGADTLTRSRLLNHVSPNTIRIYDAVLPGELSHAREQARVVGLKRYMGEGL